MKKRKKSTEKRRKHRKKVNFDSVKKKPAKKPSKYDKVIKTGIEGMGFEEALKIALRPIPPSHNKRGAK